MKAEDIDEANSHYDHGLNYSLGAHGYEKDDRRAFMHFSNAAMLGHPSGMYYLAQSYRLGKGVKVDDKAFQYWVVKSLESKAAPAPAYYSMGGILMRQGKRAKAKKLFQAGFSLGHLESGLAYITVIVNENALDSTTIEAIEHILSVCHDNNIPGTGRVEKGYRALLEPSELEAVPADTTLH